MHAAVASTCMISQKARAPSTSFSFGKADGGLPYLVCDGDHACYKEYSYVRTPIGFGPLFSRAERLEHQHAQA